MLFPSLAAWLFESTGSHLLLTSVAALYFGVTQLATPAGFIASAFLFEEGTSVKSGVAAIGLILLAGGILGMVLVGLSHVLTRHYRGDVWLDSNKGGMRRLNVAMLLISLLLIGWLISLILTFFEWYAIEQAGLQSIEASTMLGAFLIASLVAFVSGPLTDLFDWLTFRSIRRKFGRQSFIVLGLLLLCIGSGMLLFVGNAKGLMVALSVAGLGFGIFTPPLIALVVSGVSHCHWGMAMGLYLAVNSLANGLGGLVGGLAADRFGLKSPFVIGLVIAIVALFLTLIAVRFQGAQDSQ